MEQVQIFTNNPGVCAVYTHAAHWVEGGVSDVFTAVRDAVHQGARVLSHPLSGSVKPWESPYKSVVIHVARGALCFQSLQLIENAVSSLRRLRPHCQSIKIDTHESVLADYRIIDLDLIKSALEGISCQTFTTSLL